MTIRAVLFDFDGTLADSFAAITASTNHVRGIYGLPAIPESTVREHVGLGLANLMETLAPQVSTADAVAAYHAHHPSVMVAGTKLFPGVRETVIELHQRGYLLAVCSNKAVCFTKQLVKDLGLNEYFPVVLGPEDVGKAKPDPAMLFEGVKRLGSTVAESVYIGDMAVDVHTAKAAGMRVWLVPGGATGQESATAAGPDRTLNAFADILELVSNKEKS